MHAMSAMPRASRRLRSLAALALLTGLATAVLLQGCSGGSSNNVLPVVLPPPASTPPAPEPDAATVDANLQAAWVEIGENDTAIARVITSYSAPADATKADANAVCPQLTLDGNATRMTLRIGAGSMALRTTASPPADSKPSAFPVSTCETALPASAKQAAVGSRVLPLPKVEPQRVLVLADTGCRMKKADKAYQPCNDTTVWPFAPIATTGAGFNPDLVLHIGDYHYRENECPADIAGCKGSPWGYGWDTWQADFFTPAAPLLAKAPWVLVRGNHEECARGGQGWARFLDPHPYADKRSCNDPANDDSGNYADPYAVALGAGSQLIVFDSARAGKTALATNDPQFIAYQKQFQAVTALAAKPGMTTTMFTNHHPILAFAPVAGQAPLPGNLALQSVMESVNAKAYYPAGVHVALHGHVHDFQALNFATDHPATIVAGNGGDNLDVALADPLPAGATPAPGVTIDRITHHASFGFMMMERKAAPGVGWNFKAYTVAGKLLATCVQTGRALACDKTGFLTP